jgi:type IV secretion system protein VirB3
MSGASQPPPAAEAERLAGEPLFLACTRPALILGVPMEAMGVNLIVSSVAFLAGRSLAWLLIAPVLHLVFQAICKADANAFRVLYLFLETKGRCRNSGLWGGSSASPLPLRRRRGGPGHG